VTLTSFDPVVTPLDWNDKDTAAVIQIKALAADAVEKAGNGHPGTAISLSPAAYLLFQKVMRHDPSDPHWIGRDRFILSCGHSSLTIYLQLMLAGYGLEVDDIAKLRQLGSLTPGHPELDHTKGVEITTGPLGQGLASATGFAMAARRERGLFDPNAAPGTSPFDHHVYVLAGDGDIQEGVAFEAGALAGHHELGNLIVIWDDNHISIEGRTGISFSEDVLARYEAMGWHTSRVDWTHGGTEYREDIPSLAEAIEAAKAQTSRPSIIALRTIIGWPAPNKQDTYAIHGSALGKDEVADLKRALGLDPDVHFHMDDDVLAYTREVGSRQTKIRGDWEAAFSDWRKANPENAALLERLQGKEFPANWTDALPTYEANEKGVATRVASGDTLTALAPVLPELWGGSADLAPSNNTTMKGAPSFIPADRATDEWPGDQYGRTLHFGIREHGMGAILNGIVLGGVTRAYGGTFFQFADYMRGSVRLAALMKAPSIFVWTHDSIGLGEDGPTHQPVEHLWAYRAIPGLDIVRPADANETAMAWRGILENDKNPAGLILSRQNLPVFPRGGDTGFAEADGVLKGAYVLYDSPAADGEVAVILIGTGSEVQLALGAAKALEAEGIKARVVSAPSLEWFERESAEYRESVLPKAVRARVAVEAGLGFGWHQYVGDAGRIVSLEHFGESAPGDVLFSKYGFTTEHVLSAARESLAAVSA
jgi:transketolase